MGFNVRIVRHGEMVLNRFENLDKIIKHNSDSPLTARGIAEAEALGKSLKDVEFQRVYSSDYLRARQTAECVLKESRKPVPEIIVDRRVRERDLGEWEEKTPLDIIEESRKLRVFPWFIPTTRGESVEQVSERAGNFFQELCKASDESSRDENILVTSHAAFNSCFIEHLINSPELYELENFNKEAARKHSPNTGVIQISIGKADARNRRALNFIQIHGQQHLENQILPD